MKNELVWQFLKKTKQNKTYKKENPLSNKPQTEDTGHGGNHSLFSLTRHRVRNLPRRNQKNTQKKKSVQLLRHLSSRYGYQPVKKKKKNQKTGVKPMDEGPGVQKKRTQTWYFWFPTGFPPHWPRVFTPNPTGVYTSVLCNLTLCLFSISLLYPTPFDTYCLTTPDLGPRLSWTGWHKTPLWGFSLLRLYRMENNTSL